jgi:dTDP-4-dehydrorhamnose reductase
MKNAAPKAIVLGGQNGMLGRALSAAVAAKGWVVVTNAPGEFDYFSKKLADNLAAYIDRHELDILFNTVAYTNVDKAEDEEDKAAALNKNLPAVLAKLVKTRPIKLVHYSTDFVFDGKKTTPYTVDDQPNPTSAYGRTKYAGEIAIREAAPENYAIIRTAWLYGHGKKNFVQTILGICRERGGANVVFDQIGSPTYAKDLADYSLALLELEGNGLFHIVNSGQASWCEFAGEATNYAQLECPITPVTSLDFGSKVARPAYSVLDCTSFTQITGITPRSWAQALREYLMLDLVAPSTAPTSAPKSN